MHITIVQKIKNYLRLHKLTAQERNGFEALRQHIINNPEKIIALEQPVDYSLGASMVEAYMLDSNIKILTAHSVNGETHIVNLPDGPETIINRHHCLNVYVAYPDGRFADLTSTKRGYILYKTIKRHARKYNNVQPHNIQDYTKNFYKTYGAHAR